MALQKQVVPISYGGGLDTKTDPGSVPLGKWLILQNCTFKSPRSLRKRNGYSTLAGIGTGQGMAAFDAQLLTASADTLYSYAAGAFTSPPQPKLISASVSKQSVIRNAHAQFAANVAVNGTQVAYACESVGSAGSGAPFLNFYIFDQSTGKPLFSSENVLTKHYKPKILVVGGQFVMFAVDGATPATLKGGVLSTSGWTPVALTATSGLSRLNPTTRGYDACVVGTRIYVVYDDNSQGQVLSTLPLILSDGGVSAFYVTSAAPTTPVGLTRLWNEPGKAVCVFNDQKTAAPVFVFATAATVRYIATDLTLARVSTAQIEALASVVSISGVSTSASAIAWSIFYSVSAAQRYNYRTRMVTVGAAYALTTPIDWMLSVALAGKAFLYLGTAYVVVAHQSALQSTYFIVQASSLSASTSYVVAKILYGIGGGHPSTTLSSASAPLPESVSLGGSKWLFAMLEKDLLTTVSGTLYTQTGVDGITVDFFDTQKSYGRVELGENLHWSGGYPQMFDGVNNVEHGFHVFPENVSVASPGVGYLYVAVYSWMDNQGQIHRSAPSPAVAASAIGDVTVPCLRVTSRRPAIGGSEDTGPVWVEIYRTTNATAAPFYMVTDPLAPLYNNTLGDSVVFTDAVLDANLIGNTLLYTNGGVVENVEPGPCSALLASDSRVWGIDSLTGAIFYSKQVVPGVPVEFSDLLTFNADQRLGAPTALGLLDGKKIVFRVSGMTYLVGQGPDSTGNQNDLFEYPITSDAGCSNPRSIVTMPHGLMFQSAKGIYLLDRSLQVSYIGAEVEGYNAQTVTSAALIPGSTQVRFTMSGGVALVYDYLLGQWSVFTNIAAVDATIWAGSYVYLTAAGAANQETALFADPGNTFIPIKAVSPWIQMAGMQGFQRIYRVLLLADYISAHQLTFKLAYDFAGSFAQTDNVTVSSDLNPYQLRFACAKQKCQAIQISVEDVSTGTLGESLSLSSLALEVGIKRGAFKLPAAQSYG